MENNDIKQGDVVYLKSGSPSMTVKRWYDYGWECSWFVDYKVEEHVFFAEQLTTTKTKSVDVT